MSNSFNNYLVFKWFQLICQINDLMVTVTNHLAVFCRFSHPGASYLCKKYCVINSNHTLIRTRTQIMPKCLHINIQSKVVLDKPG